MRALKTFPRYLAGWHFIQRTELNSSSDFMHLSYMNKREPWAAMYIYKKWVYVLPSHAFCVVFMEWSVVPVYASQTTQMQGSEKKIHGCKCVWSFVLVVVKLRSKNFHHRGGGIAQNNLLSFNHSGIVICLTTEVALRCIHFRRVCVCVIC